MSSLLIVQRLTPTAILPRKGSEMAAGYDLSASEACVVPANGKALVPTGLSIALPSGVYGRIAPRSGLAWKHHIDVGAGVIDRDYRGPVGIVLFNHAGVDFQVAAGDRVAQLILEKYEEDTEVVEVDSLPESVRGDCGFGSTGIKRMKPDNEIPANERDSA